MSARLSRMKKEIEMLANDPGPGISAWPANDDNMMILQAQIQGPQESPYQEGLYSLTIDIPDRYPFEPPRVRFTTPIYHPNIDSDGRICLDTLKMQPHGSWSPSININTLLLTIRVLMGSPNADDGLVPDITEEYKRDVALWRRKALEHTRLNAIPSKGIKSQLKSESPSAAVVQRQPDVVHASEVDLGSDQESDDSDTSDDEDDDESDSEDDTAGQIPAPHNTLSGNRRQADDTESSLPNSKSARQS